MSNSWDRVVNAAACTTLTQLGGALVNAGAWTALTGVGAKPALAAIGIGSLSNLAASALCPEIDLPVTPSPNNGQGCWKVTSGDSAFIEVRTTASNSWVRYSTISPWIDATEIVSVQVVGPDLSNKYTSKMTYLRLSGSTNEAVISNLQTQEAAAAVAWRLDPKSGVCGAGDNQPDPLPPNYDAPIPVTDPVTSCNYTVSLQGFVRETPDQLARPVYIVESAATSRNSYGRIGGCSLEPTIVIGGGGDGGNNPPYPPIPVPSPLPPPGPDGEPWWLDLVGKVLQAGAAGAAAKLVEELLNSPLPATSKSIYAACQYKEDGTPEELTINFPEQKYQDRVLDALTAQVDFAQQFFLWKTPTCDCSPSPVTGDPVTINFESAEYSPFGNDRLRKRFVYFDQSGSTLEQTTDHWKDFVWQAGGVAVFCKGTALGKPQVWAATEDEAKRVINHAAAITGADMSKAEWITTTSKDPRYGVPGEMHVMRGKNGTFGITKRGKPSGSPPALAPNPTLGSG